MRQVTPLIYALIVLCFSSTSIASSPDFTTQGFVLSSSIWDELSIPVCWENPDAVPQEELDWVRDAVADTWEANSSVLFTGWGACSSASNGIRILISDQGPHVKSLGKGLDGFVNGMVLNFTYANWSTSCQYRRQFCSEVIAVHEFGHALGFAHEQNRDDTPDTCTDDPQGTDGDVMIGEWDLYSVMNYCNPSWNGNGQLSNTDIITLQQFYGSPQNDISPAEVCFVDASSDDGNVAENTVDQNPDTRWSANGNGQWIEYTLCDTTDLAQVDVAWFKGDQRYATFAIEAGEAQDSVGTVFSGTSSGNTDDLEAYTTLATDTNVVRITGYGNSSNSWNSITEVEIYGKTPEDDVSLNPPSNLTLTSAAPSSITLTWADNSENEEGYVIEARAGSDDYEIVSVLAANAETFTQNGLSNGIAYQYRVSSFYKETRSDYAYGEYTLVDTSQLIAPVSVSDDENDGNIAENAIDGDPDTRWSSEGIQAIEFDLGDVYTITSVEIAWYKGDQRMATYNLSVTTDNIWWSAPISFESTGETDDFETTNGFTNIEARVIRLTGFGNTSNDWNSISEIRFKGYK